MMKNENVTCSPLKGTSNHQLEIAMTQNQELRQLTCTPGVGKAIATDLWNLGVRRVSDLHGQSPEQLFDRSNGLAGKVQDRCLLYVFRCAVYYAETDERHRDKEKLKWWNWKDKR